MSGFFMANRKRYVLYAVCVILAIVAVIVVYMVYTKALYKSPGEKIADQNVLLDKRAGSESTSDNSKQVAYLYFADKSKPFLTAEERELSGSKNPEVLGKAIIKALINGPQQDLMRTIPADAGLRALYLTRKGVAYVDMTDNIKVKHPGGAGSELLTIYSIVNSLVVNIPEITSVKILIGGTESMTLAGHIDLRFPFKANMLIVR